LLILSIWFWAAVCGVLLIVGARLWQRHEWNLSRYGSPLSAFSHSSEVCA
jgi:hypothetical protein